MAAMACIRRVAVLLCAVRRDLVRVQCLPRVAVAAVDCTVVTDISCQNLVHECGQDIFGQFVETPQN